MKTHVLAKAALCDGGCLSISSDKRLDRGLVQPGEGGRMLGCGWRGLGQRGELVSMGRLNTTGALGLTKQAGFFLCSPPGGRTGSQG